MREKFLIAVIIIFSLVLCGCSNSKNISTDYLMNELEAYFSKELHSCKYVYKKSASQYSRSFLTSELAGIIYYGVRTEKLWELDLLSDYSIRLADDESCFEIHILKVRSRSDVDTIEKMLRKRLEYLQNRSIYSYIPDDYEEHIMSAQVYVIESFVVFLSTPDNARAYEILKGII